MNAQIQNCFLGYEDHGILTISLDLRMNDYNQQCGFYKLTGTHLARWVQGIMDTLEVRDWSSVKGKYCRVIKDDKDRIVGIQNIVKDELVFLFDAKYNVEKVRQLMLKPEYWRDQNTDIVKYIERFFEDTVE